MRNTVLIILFFLMGCQSTGPVNHDDLMFVSHRGITVERYPENTLKSFRNVIERNIKAVELDVRTSSNGYVVIMHDRKVNRTTDGTGRVEDLTFEEIRSLDAGDGEQVPTLDEVLDLFQETDVTVLIDVKDEKIDTVEIVVGIEIRNMEHQVILGARYPEHVEIFKKLNPSIRVLGFTPNMYFTEEFVERGIDVIRVKAEWVNRRGEQLIEAGQYGLPVWVTSYFPSTIELKLYPIYEVTAVITDNI